MGGRGSSSVSSVNSTRSVESRIQDAEGNSEAFVKDKAKSWESNLSPEERTAVVKYTGETYKKINGPLRDGKDPNDVPFVKDIDAALAKSVTDRDLVVHRGITSGALNNLFDGGEITGKIIDHKGFVSTGREKTLGGGVGIQAHILVPKGFNAAPVERISRNKKEKEILLPRGTGLRVVRAYEDSQGRRHVICEAVPPPKKGKK